MTTWNELASSIRFGSLVTADGWTYRFTAEDLKWGARYVVGEIGEFGSTDEAFVLLWSMANRMYRIWPSYRTYAKMVQAYSIALHGDPIEVPRRARMQTLQPDDIEPETMRRVVLFVSGRAQPGVGVGLTHQATCPSSGLHPRLGPADYIGPSGECYWRDDSWGGGGIWAEPEGGRAGGSAFTPIAAGAAVFGIAMLIAWASG